jgi:hypothetical protein
MSPPPSLVPTQPPSSAITSQSDSADSLRQTLLVSTRHHHGSCHECKNADRTYEQTMRDRATDDSLPADFEQGFGRGWPLEMRDYQDLQTRLENFVSSNKSSLLSLNDPQFSIGSEGSGFEDHRHTKLFILNKWRNLLLMSDQALVSMYKMRKHHIEGTMEWALEAWNSMSSEEKSDYKNFLLRSEGGLTLGEDRNKELVSGVRREKSLQVLHWHLRSEFRYLYKGTSEGDVPWDKLNDLETSIYWVERHKKKCNKDRKSWDV